METNYTGAVVAIAALIVSFAAQHGWILNQSDVIAVIGGIISIVGIVKQMMDHKKLAVAAGAAIAKAKAN